MPGHLAFASEKTGIILTQSNAKKVADVDIEEWRTAAEEYYELEELGIDPYLTLDFGGPDEAVLVLCAHEALETAAVHLSSFIDKAQRRKIRGLDHVFTLYFASRAFNAAKTIYNVTKDMEARELVGVARSIYECYLRIKYLRLKPAAAEDFAAQASLGNGIFRFKELGGGKLSKNVIINADTGEVFQARIPFATMAAASKDPADAEVHDEFYGLMSSVGHADATELTSYFSLQHGFFLAPKGSQAEVLSVTLIALAFMFDELSSCDWAPRVARRDARYIARRTAKGLCKACWGFPGSAAQLRATLKRLATIALTKAR